MARPEKEASVAEIAERFNESDAALLTEYRGLRVAEIAEVRNSLRDSDSDYKVLKNTLARIAVREVGLEELVEMLSGPTAIAFIRGDAAAAAKALDEAAKKYPVLEIKGGVLNGKVITADQARELAKLEPREVLLAKIAMLMNTPAQQTVNVFAALLRDFGSMLAQVVAKKESGELPGGAGEAPAEETPAAEVTAEPVEAEPAEQAVEAAAEGGATAGDETEAAAETAPAETPAEEAATEAEPPAELAEAVDQAPAAPESEAAETQEPETTDDSTSEESATKEEE